MENVIPTLSAQGDWASVLQAKLSWCRLERIRKARVMVVGCGALGNEVLKNLALFGVGFIVIVDFDEVEESNLTRSILFSQDDAMRSIRKVDAVSKKIKEINPEINVISLYGDIYHVVGLGLLKKMDAVIACVDNRWARFCINRLCMRAGVKWIDGGIDGLEGTARVFSYRENCYACNLSPDALSDMRRRMSCASIIQRNEKADRAATTPLLASIIAAVQVQEFLKIIHEREKGSERFTSLCGKMFYYEGESLSTKLLNFKGYDDECPEHENWGNFESSSLSADDKVKYVLETIQENFHDVEAEIELRNHSFVDYLILREGNEKRMVLLPSFRVSSYIERCVVWKGKVLSDFYQHEYSVINKDFPYMDLSLKDLGVPYWDVLQVATREGIHYVELDRDKDLYPAFN